MEQASFETQDQGTAAEPAAPVAAPEAAARPPLELVTEPGRVKHIRFEGAPPATQAPTPAPEPTRAPTTPPPPPPSYTGRSRGPLEESMTRRTLYRTEQGGEVVAYESRGRRELLTVTERTRDGRLEERRFDSRLVDAIVKDVPLEERVEEQAEAAQPPTPDAPAETATGSRRFRLFGRRAPGEDSGASYHPATAVEAHEAQATDEVHAWEPSAIHESSHDLVAQEVATFEPPAPAAPARRGPYVDYRGDSHPVSEIEGIGAATAKRLGELGIHTTARLCAEDAALIARRLDIGEYTVRSWQAMAQLIKVKGIGKQSAEVLARVGVEGIDDLKARDPEQLESRIDAFLAAQASAPIGARISAKRIAGWQKVARRMRKVRQDVEAL